MSQRTLSKKLSSLKPGTLYVGVDLALDHNVAVVLIAYHLRPCRWLKQQSRQPELNSGPTNPIGSPRVYHQPG